MALDGAKSNLRVHLHSVRVAVSSWHWWATSLIFLGFWVGFGWPIYERNVVHGVVHTALALVMVVGRAWRWAAPRTMQIVERDYLTRKLALYQLVRDLQRREDFSAREIQAFQVSALRLIASYVRSHRGDSRATSVFVNLVVLEGDDIIVVARDREHRQPLARYPKAGLLVTRVLETGMPQVTGDAYADFPQTLAGKPYRSILGLPVYGDAGIVGVVSIDSSERYHFDRDGELLDQYLKPYVGLLAWTLTAAPTKLTMTDGRTGGGDQ